MQKKTAFLTVALFGALWLWGCKSGETEKITSIEQLNNPAYTIGVPEGGAGMYMAEKYLPKAEHKTFSGNSSGYLAISQGKLDGFVYDRVMMEFAIASGLEGVEILEENLGESMDVAVGISPKSRIDNLKEKVNQFLAKAKAEGTLDDMYDRWVSRAEGTMPEIPAPQMPDCKLKVGTTGTVQPFSYYEGTTLTGYDVELIYRFGAWLNAEVEIKIYDYDGIIAAAQAGDIDCIMANLNATEERRKHIEFSDCVYPSVTAVMVRSQQGSGTEAGKIYETLSDFEGARFAALIGGVYDKLLQEVIADAVSGSMSITEEREKKVDFADSHYDSAMVLLVRDAGGAVQKNGFFAGLEDSFQSTFVVEGRWRLILQGLGITILISVFSGIFGLCLGFGLCMLRRTGCRPVQWFGAVFVRVIQGMPIVVFLMILYYGIFGSVDISEILVAVIGFSINFAAYSSEMMRTGIETVDKGQSEAALAMGYTKSQTFFKIVFPQAAINFIPVLKGEFISMVKMTSVVGYIAVQDLTKVSDIIRSRTMEAFFPLIVTAVIYFAVANVMTAALSFAERKASPKRNKRRIKGVCM